MDELWLIILMIMLQTQKGQENLSQKDLANKGMSYPQEPKGATLKCLQICIYTWALPDYSGKHISTTQFEKKDASVA